MNFIPIIYRILVDCWSAKEGLSRHRRRLPFLTGKIIINKTKEVRTKLRIRQLFSYKNYKLWLIIHCLKILRYDQFTPSKITTGGVSTEIVTIWFLKVMPYKDRIKIIGSDISHIFILLT